MKNKTILMIMIITIFFTGCSKTKNNELLHEGKIALEKHDYTNAQDILSQVLTADSTNEHARSMYMQAVKMKDALEYENKQLYDKAIQSLEEVEKLKGGSSDIKSEAAEKRKELTKLNEEYKKDQEKRKENAKYVSGQDKSKLEQNALKENQKQEEAEKEEENQEEQKQEEQNKEESNQPENTQDNMTQENDGSTTQPPSENINQSTNQQEIQQQP